MVKITLILGLKNVFVLRYAFNSIVIIFDRFKFSLGESGVFIDTRNL